MKQSTKWKLLSGAEGTGQLIELFSPAILSAVAPLFDRTYRPPKPNKAMLGVKKEHFNRLNSLYKCIIEKAEKLENEGYDDETVAKKIEPEVKDFKEYKANAHW